jgi:hypothetical protein
VPENFVRFTISLTKDLKKRMDRFEGAANWSAVARVAFEKEVEKMENAETVGLDPKVVARLRDSKERREADLVRTARAEGRRWAAEEAEYFELRNLASYVEVRGYDFGKHPSEEFVTMVMGVEGDEFHDAYNALWDGRNPSAAYVQAFAEAALDIYIRFQSLT